MDVEDKFKVKKLEEVMAALKDTFEQEIKTKFISHPDVEGVIMFVHREQTNQLVDGFDVLWLVLTNKQSLQGAIHHYIRDSLHIQEYWIDHDTMHQWILDGKNGNLVQWILQGEIIFDKHSFFQLIREDLLQFPAAMREQRLFIEFSNFLRDYLQAKEYLRQDHVLDAYSHILSALHHWARIVIIENRNHPEVTVWKQVYHINAGVYKLYEELTSSHETLEKRVELVLLACDFSVMSKMKNCCNLLFRLMESKDTWSLQELQEYLAANQLSDISNNLTLLLRKLAKRNHIQEIKKESDGSSVLYKLL